MTGVKHKKGHVKKKLRTAGTCQPVAEIRIGPVLLGLRDAIMQSKRYWKILDSYGLGHKIWVQIGRDMSPNDRFLAGPVTPLEKIVDLLHNAGEPMRREELLQKLLEAGVGPRRRIRISISANLRNGNLIYCQGRKIGLREMQ